MTEPSSATASPHAQGDYQFHAAAVQPHAFPLQTGPHSIGWGILGTGERARQIVLEAIRRQTPLTPHIAAAWAVGVYSHNTQRATQFAHDLYLPHSYTNLIDLLQRREVQAIYIASHPRHHFPLAMAALTAGKHVLCETPLALSIEEAETLHLAALHRGLLLGVAHQLRADPAIRQLRHLLTDEAIGDLLGGRITNTTPLYRHQQGWRLQPTVGGVLRDRLPAAVDLIRYLLHDEVATIYATSTQQLLTEGGDRTIEEDVQSLITFRRSKLTIQVHLSYFIPHLPTIFELYGTRGTLQIQHWADPTRPSQLFFIQNHHATVQPLPPGNADRQLIAAFMQAMQLHTQSQEAGEGALLATAGDGIQNLRIALSAQQSLTSNQRILVGGANANS